MKRIIIVAGIIIIAAASLWTWKKLRADKSGDAYTFAQVTRGNIENTVTCTGTLSAVGTVDVGTQVSGIIERILVDFNDDVKKEQLLAVLDTAALVIAVRDAKAGMMRSEAQLEQAESEFRYNEGLYQKTLISEQVFIASKTAVKTARANLLSSQASLKRAQTNLRHAFIYSPIDGKVISRNIEPGQTVAASFSAPTLFVIAEDLSEMEIHALVDESDIG